MVDLLTLLTICMMERMWKSFVFSCKIGWAFIKFTAWLIIVPALSIFFLSIAAISFTLGKIFKKRTPTLKHTKRWIIYPTWNI